ncbi:MAG: hypothetical protein PHI27_00845 [Eubacteriales bacterium]|nr:hypothetical protein [Eubacteriales bacterium]MDD3880781.1 hypothetical protein [Eubacteriales bacterium]MDD4511852.1 hypothetical protein [Eubacteriales bacterium]
MIQVISGKKGSGKTKRLIDMANAAMAQQHGDVIFLDDDNRYMFDLRHEIRFINAGDYHLLNAEMFSGFLTGMLASNFDISVIFVDAFKKLAKNDLDSLSWFFERLEQLSQKHSVDFVLSVSGAPEELPDFINKYAI